MGNALGYQTTREDGSRRDAWAIFLDPVGACIQPSAIEPWHEPEAVAVEDDDEDYEDDMEVTPVVEEETRM